MRADPAAALSAAVDAFLTYSSVERDLSPRTIEAYARDLVRFIGHLDSRGVRDAREVRREHLAGFAEELERRGLGARSRARALVAARRFLRHVGAERALTEDPGGGRAGPRFEMPLPRTLRPDETAALIEAVDASTPLGLRDRAMLEVLYGAGLRVSELVALPLGGFDRRAGLLRVLGKGRRERIVPLGEPAVAALEAYLGDGRPALVKRARRASDAIFLSRRGGG
jgi:integrase/recombinase XerD